MCCMMANAASLSSGTYFHSFLFLGGGTYFLKNSKDFYSSSRGMGSSILSTQNKMMATFPLCEI